MFLYSLSVIIASSLLQLHHSGRLNTQTETGLAGPSKIFAYLPGAQTLGPSGTGQPCPGLRGACCHPVDILLLIFFHIFSFLNLSYTISGHLSSLLLGA